MFSRPEFVDDGTIVRAVAAHWLPGVTGVEYLAVGFGAYHWRARAGGTSLFVTLDRLEPRHTAASLEAAYAGAAALAAGGLDVVCAPLASRSGAFTVDVGPGTVSVTPWLDGHTPPEGDASDILAGLDALHRAVPPAGLRRWTPCVGPDFADDLRRRTAEPHHRNQLVVGGTVKLVDWESLALAPPANGTSPAGSRARTPRCGNCSPSTGVSPRSPPTPDGSPHPTPAPRTTTSPSGGCWSRPSSDR